MAELCECPNPDALDSITDYDCPIDFSEIAKLFFCRTKVFPGTTQPPTVITIATLLEWVSVLTAGDDTKMLISPIVDDIENEPGAAITEELTTRNIVTGYEPTTFTGLLAGAPQTTAAEFSKLTCEKILYVYLVDADGNIIHAMTGTAPEGFKLENNSFSLLDLELKKRTINKNRLSFQLEPGWSKTAVKTTPLDFDALTDLINTSS